MLIAVDLKGIKPDWSLWTKSDIWDNSRLPNTFASILISAVSSKIGLYESGFVGSLSGFGITMIVASVMDYGRINTAVQCQCALSQTSGM